MIDVEAEDVIVAGTDGVVYDNLYNDEITVVVVSSARPGLDPNATAQKIADLARSRAVDQQRLDAGGKLDDITAVVSYVTLHQLQRPSIVLLLTPPPFAFVTVITDPPTPDNECMPTVFIWI